MTKKILTLYLAWGAGVASAAVLAYWYWVHYMDQEPGEAED